MQERKKSNLVSIGLPTYNRPEELRNILHIITEQTYTNLEIIISDNASPNPKVQDVIREFSENDSRIKHYRQIENIGVIANADFVLKKASGVYFAWISDDDWRAPEFIELLVQELNENEETKFAFCDYCEVSEDGQKNPIYPLSHLKTFRPFTHKKRLVRTIAFYWQDAVLGKPNLFYSVYRRNYLDQIDLKKITQDYELLNMDCLIVFLILQCTNLIIRDEMMCVLTYGNKKLYLENKEQNKIETQSYIKKVAKFWKDHKNDRNLYIKNTTSRIEKIIIYNLFPLKVLNMMCGIVKTRIQNIRKQKTYQRKLNLRSQSKPNSTTKEKNNKSAKLKLPNITLVAMATRNVEATASALEYSCRDIEYGSVKLISNYTPYNLSKNVEFYRIEKIKSIDEWSYKIIYQLEKYIDTEYALLVHADGFVVNPLSWRDEFLDYDYVGAPWPLPRDKFSYRDIKGNIVRVGNSVSLRSKKLLELPIKLNLPWEPLHGYWNEDGFICVKNKHIYEEAGLKFAPLTLAKYFSHESMIPEIAGIKPFAFHKWFGTNKNYPKF